MILILIAIAAGIYVFWNASKIAQVDISAVNTAQDRTSLTPEETTLGDIIDNIANLEKRVDRIQEDTISVRTETQALLLQTNITRFGTLTLVFFLASIMVSQYRYSIRIAAFYDAKADVLELWSSGLSNETLEILSTVLTPDVTFGKTPTGPVPELFKYSRGQQGS